MTSSSVRAECRWTAFPTASMRSRLRSMLMIGVTPLPAEMNSNRSGGSSGSTKSPSTPPRRTMSPGRASLVKYGETTPSSTRLGVIAM